MKRLQAIFLILLCMIAGQVRAEERTVTFDATVDKAPYGELTLTKGDVTIQVSSGRLGYYSENVTDDYYVLSASNSLSISVPGANVSQITFTSDTKNKTTPNGMKNLKYEGSGLTRSTFKNEEYTLSWSGTASGTLKFSTSSTIHFTKIEITYTKTKELAGISFGDETSFTVTAGDDFSEPTLSNPNNLTVTYSSSNASLASVDAETGEVTIGSTSGTVTITARSEETETYAAGVAQYSITIIAASTESYYFELVTDASTLEEGDIIVIANREHEVTMGEQLDNKKRNKCDIVGLYSNIIEIGENTVLLKLERSSSGWAFRDGEQYLCATSGDANDLWLKATKDEYSYATINISDGNATIRFNTNNTYSRYLQYNVEYEWFSCYNNTQSPVQIYRQTTPKEYVSTNVSSVGYATLYYSDKNLIVPDGLVAKTYYVEDGTTLHESKVYSSGDIIPAATGVILKGAPGDYNFEVTTDKGAADAQSTLRGSDNDATTTGGTLYYKLAVDPESGACGFYWGSENGAAFTNKAHKAYLATNAELSGGAKSCFIFDDAVSAIDSPTTVTKENQHIFWNLQGQAVDASRLPKGIYIKNGKKYIFK